MRSIAQNGQSIRITKWGGSSNLSTSPNKWSSGGIGRRIESEKDK